MNESPICAQWMGTPVISMDKVSLIEALTQMAGAEKSERERANALELKNLDLVCELAKERRKTNLFGIFRL